VSVWCRGYGSNCRQPQRNGEKNQRVGEKKVKVLRGENGERWTTRKKCRKRGPDHWRQEKSASS